MEHDSRGSGSESDLSDGWTVLNSFTGQDIPSQKGGHAEASDEDSIESFDVEKVDIPIRDEESDGISVISESDICDPVEAIPNIRRVPEDEREHIEELQIYSGIPPVQHSISRRRCQDSFSESDSCELPDSPVNLSLCPRRVRRQRFNGPLPIAELDSCNYVDDFPTLATGARIPSGNETCMRIYVHRPNDQINYLLTILLVLALAAVAGLGTGHFLGTKEILETPEEIVYKLRLENEILQNQLHKLLKEREVWRRLSANYNTANSKFTGKSDNMYLECSKSTSSVHCFPGIPSDLNRTLTSDQVPISVVSYSMGKSYPSWGTDFQNANSLSNNNKFLFSDQSEVNNLKVIVGRKNKFIKSANDKRFSKTIPNYIPSRGNSIIKEMDKNKVCFGKEAEKLAQDVKLALVHGLELSGKLEQALSSLDTALINMKNLKTKSASSRLDENGSLGKKALQGIKDILHDGDKSKALISKTVSKLYSMKSKLFKSYEDFNFWKGKVLEEDTHSKPDGEHSSNVMYGPNLPSESDETSSNLYSNPAHTDNFSGVKCDLRNPSDFYGPHLPSSVNEPIALPNVLEDVDEVNVDYSSNLVKSTVKDINIVSKDLDMLTPVHAGGGDSRVQNSFNDAQSAIEFNELHPHLEPKQLLSEEVELKHETFPSVENFESVDQSKENEIPKHGKMQQLNENSKKHGKKQKNDLKEQYTHIVKTKESPRLSHEQKYHSDRKKKQKHKPQKFPGKGAKGENFFKNDAQQRKHEQESKHKHKSKFQDEYENKHDYKSFHKKNHDSKRHVVNKLHEKSVKSTKYTKNNEHKRDYKPFHKKNQDSNRHVADKLYEKTIKNAKNMKNKDSKHLFKHKKRNNIRHDQSAWSIDENGYRFTNTSGDWLMKLYKERARQREENQRSDWLFERATARKTKREEDREKARWYFQRARSRQVCRVDPTAEWCKSRDEDLNKFHKGEFWKRTHSSKRDNSEHDHDNSQYNQRDFRLKHAARHLRGTKYFSEAFRSAMNFFKHEFIII